MGSSDLLIICGVAFLFVFAILVVLALIMRLIIFVFPEKLLRTDAAVIAAISGAVQTIFPGTKITNIEEKK